MVLSYRVRLVWVPGHCGNEEADALAGSSSAFVGPEPCLPLGPSSVKRRRGRAWLLIKSHCALDGWIVSGGVALLHAGHKTGLMCTTVLSLLSQSLILYSSWVHGRNNFCVACIWLRKSEVTGNTL
jgi:hypothetical protein